MKSFTTSTLAFAALTSLFFVVATVQATVFPRDGIPPINVPLNLIPEYFKLLAKCNANDATVRRVDPMYSLIINMERNRSHSFTKAALKSHTPPVFVSQRIWAHTPPSWWCFARQQRVIFISEYLFISFFHWIGTHPHSIIRCSLQDQ